jgi:hypothetical protein
MQADLQLPNHARLPFQNHDRKGVAVLRGVLQTMTVREWI